MSKRNDSFQRDRAEQARKLFASVEYSIELSRDKINRENHDRAAGHIPQCSLMKCHPDCPKA